MMKRWMHNLSAATAAAFLLVATAGQGLALEWGSQELEPETMILGPFGFAALLVLALAGWWYARRFTRGIVRTDELKKWLDEGKQPLLVDTMPLADSYAKQHLPGAVQYEFPIEELTAFDAKGREAYQQVLGPDKGRLIVIYCGFTKCGRSHNGAWWAKQVGYTNVYRYPGGIKAWEQADYPLEKGQ